MKAFGQRERKDSSPMRKVQVQFDGSSEACERWITSESSADWRLIERIA